MMIKISKSMIFAIQFLTIALLLNGSLGGCSARKKETGPSRAGLENQSLRSVSTPAPEFKLILASGGGFTTLWQGYSLYPDGRVENWQRFGARADSILWIGQAEPQEIDRFHQELRKLGFMDQEIQHWGNISQSVSYVTPETTLVWVWTEDNKDQLPGEFKNWYDRVREFCTRLKKQ